MAFPGLSGLGDREWVAGTSLAVQCRCTHTSNYCPSSITFPGLRGLCDREWVAGSSLVVQCRCTHTSSNYCPSSITQGEKVVPGNPVIPFTKLYPGLRNTKLRGCIVEALFYSILICPQGAGVCKVSLSSLLQWKIKQLVKAV